MAAIGFSLNNLTLFGLVLAIGIVVDDAIVVVEAVEHHIEEGMSPRRAAFRAMEEVSGPVVAVALVLSAVFVPCAFISGITGQFFRQFALTIAVSTIISAFNSLTLSPALAAILLPARGARKDLLARILDLILGWFFRAFNWTFRRCTGLYTRMVGLALRGSLIVLLLYGGLVGLTLVGFNGIPALKGTPRENLPEPGPGPLLHRAAIAGCRFTGADTTGRRSHPGDRATAGRDRAHDGHHRHVVHAERQRLQLRQLLRHAR